MKHLVDLIVANNSTKNLTKLKMNYHVCVVIAALFLEMKWIHYLKTTGLAVSNVVTGLMKVAGQSLAVSLVIAANRKIFKIIQKAKGKATFEKTDRKSVV